MINCFPIGESTYLMLVGIKVIGLSKNVTNGRMFPNIPSGSNKQHHILSSLHVELSWIRNGSDMRFLLDLQISRNETHLKNGKWTHKTTEYPILGESPPPFFFFFRLNPGVISAGLLRTGTIASELTLKASLISVICCALSDVTITRLPLRVSFFFILFSCLFLLLKVRGDESVSLQALLSRSQEEKSGRL